MSGAKNSSSAIICSHCSHRNVIDLPSTEDVVCERCGHSHRRVKPKSLELTLAFSITALVLYIPANIYPFMTIELYGNRNSSTIWSGVVSLFESGAWAVALVVFLASLFIPLLKLAILFYLALTARTKKHPHFKNRLYKMVEAIGRWSMLDIFLLAVLVAVVKLAPWAHVQPEFGSLMFLLVVIFTMLASAYFDPKLLWEEENDRE